SLEAIAQGKKAQDPQGLAKDYAQRLLDKLDDAKGSKAPKLLPLREGSLDWFPSNITSAGAIDLRRGRVADAKDVIASANKSIGDDEDLKRLETFGNIRVDQFSYGYADGNGNSNAKVYLRLTGKFNHAWVADGIQGFSRHQSEVKKSKDDNGVPITTLKQE